jgi:hypothetical protein
MIVFDCVHPPAVATSQKAARKPQHTLRGEDLNHDKHLEVDETTRLDAKIPNSQVAS